MNLSSIHYKRGLEHGHGKAGFIIRVDEVWTLIKEGEQSGGIYKTHARHGRYIVWPEAMLLP
ncbi:MAG: hypothetical protein V5783_10755 [Pontiella sp.]